MKTNPLFADGYKLDHRRQYRKGTQRIFSNFTPRSSKLKNIPDSVFLDRNVCFGVQYFCKAFLIDLWNREFFQRPKDEVVRAYKRRIDNYLGPDAVPVEHIAELHDIGYLPIEIRALPEGTLYNYRVPMLTIHNTDDRCFWLPNYLETVLSNMLWKANITAATALHYRYLIESYCKATGGDLNFVKWQGHDFSARGMCGIADASICGLAHLLFFTGTDTFTAIDYAEEYYNANSDNELIGGSVPATEHSVMSLSGQEDELGTFRRLVTEVYPAGIVSIVSDTWDFWQVMTRFTVELKSEIMARGGKLVFRPDSGDPVKIVCGDPDAPFGSPERDGALECLWKVYGGTTNAAGYRVLDPHVGLIYGDSITLYRCEAILSRMKEMGFCSTNIVFGIGSFTYQHVTRDTAGFAMKATYGEVDDVAHNIFKKPKTDSGMKNSAKGLLCVRESDDRCGFICENESTWERMDELSELTPVFRDGKLLRDESLATIRARAEKYLGQLDKKVVA